MAKRGAFDDVLPLSPLQEGMLFHALLDERDVYTVRLAIDLDGPFDVAAFRAAVTALLTRHPNLRAGFRAEGLSKPVQLIPREIPVPVHEIDLSDVDDPTARLAEITAAEKEVRFDLARPPLLRFTVVRTGPTTHRLLFTSHHILLDGWSTPLVIGELFQLYQGKHLPPATPFRAFLGWLGKQDTDAALAAWRDHLAGLAGPSRLVATTGPAPGLPGEVRTELDEATTAALHQLTRGRGVTMNTVVQAAWAQVLGTLTGTPDVVFGTTVSGRPPEVPGVETMVGLFINTLPVRVTVDPAEPVADLLSRMHAAQLDLLPHQHLGLADIQRAAGHGGELFDTLVVFENYPLDAAALGEAAGDLRVTGVDGGDATHYPVLLNAGPGERLWLKLSYRTDLYDAPAARALLDRVTALLTAMAADPSVPVGRLDLLTADEHRLIAAVNDTPMPVPDGTLPGLFEAQVARTPDATALVHGDTALTYAELDAAANQVANLLAARGIGAEALVAIALPSTVDAVAAMLGVLKAGAAYLPIDPAYPAERIAFMLADAAPALLITDSVTADMPTLHPGDLTGQPTTVPPRAISPNHPAYVIYTSGSTGRPKGVVVEHRSVSDYLTWTANYPGARGVAVLHSPLAFDLTVTALYTPLVVGGQVHLTDLRGATDDVPPALAADPCTFLKATPSHLGLLEALPDEFSPATELLLGGEALLGELLDGWRSRHPDAVVRNVYGPTEATVNCAEFTIEPGAAVPAGPVPIGRPQGNARLYVLDAAGRHTPPGVTGELYLAGTGLARGYLNRPGLTAERFVADPYGPPGSRMYRTGDLASRTADGDLVFHGRADDQVKLRGHRIELGEITAALLAADGVTDAVAVLREDRLVGYVVGDTAGLRDTLAATLPEYMVPSAFVRLAELPLTPNGKLDRKALPAPEFTGGAGRAPRTPQEEVLCGLFAEVLDAGAVTIDDDFFDLGGHSLLATRLVSRIRATLGVELSIRTLFENPTVAALATRTGGPIRSALVARPRPDRVPLSHAQRRLWFLNRFEGPSPTYNVPIAVRLNGQLDRDALLAAVGDVVARHESLRTVFPERDGEPCQEVLSAETAPLDLAVVDAPDLDAAVAEESARGFELTETPPVRVRLYPVTDTEHVLLVVLHHIVSDASSRAPFARDLGRAYRARAAGEAPQWTPLPVQYADFALWQHEILGTEDDAGSLLTEQAKFWRHELAGIPDELSLPVDRPRPATASYRGDLVTLDLDPELHQALRNLSRTTQASLFMVLQAGLAALLTKVGAGTDLPIGTPIAGRTDDAVDDLVGFFVNTLVLRTDTSGDPTFAELVRRVRDTDLAAYGNQDLPFERLVEILNPARSLARHPLFQVMLTLQNVARPDLGVPDLDVAQYRTYLPIAKFDLLFSFVERFAADGAPAGVDTVIEYSTDLFDRDTVTGLGTRLIRLLTLLAADPRRPLSRIDALDAAEHRRLAAWNDTAHDVPANTIPDRFAEQLARTPNELAVASEGIPLTYAQLDRLSNQLAHWLISRGVGPEQVVALAVPRSPHLVTALLATLKAGAAYLPVDPGYPAERIEFMLADARPAAVISMVSVPLPDGVAAVRLDDPVFTEGLCDYPTTAPTDADRTVPLSLAHPLYVMFTSGSTGRPKAVVMPGTAIGNLISWHHDAVPTAPGSRIAQFTAISFDVSAQEILSALLCGRCLMIPNDEIRPDPEALASWLAEERIGELYAPNLVIDAVADAANRQGIDLALTDVAQAGEALVLSDAVRELHRRHPGLRLHNHYGPTETHVVTGTTLPSDVDDWPDTASIGGPIWNTRAYVLDPWLRPVPPGVAGELYFAGTNLARGYWQRPGLTAQRFVACPFEPGARMYRTGDLAAWRPDGTLRYLGRVDHQVKIRGFRIELGEIEAVLRDHPGVGGAAVLARPTPAGTQLVAYVESDVDSAGLRRHVGAALPDYMVPSVVVPVDEFPLTPNGKLDRRALADLAVEPAEAGRAPRNPTEEALCQAYADVLGVAEVSIDDDFFALGGHSLAATRLVSAVRAALGVELPIKAVFAHPTVAELITELAPSRRRPALTARRRPPVLPLSYAQQRLWFLNRLEGLNAAYNLPFVIRVSGGVDVPALRAALGDLVERHEVLRTIYPEPGEHQQIIDPADAAPDIEHTTTSDVLPVVDEAVSRGFDLTTQPPLRVHLVEASPTDHVLILVLHHISGDGWSLRPFGMDLHTAYAARQRGEAPQWTPLPVQYADYALWQRELLGDETDPDSRAARELAYWRTQLADLPDELVLPADHARPDTASYRAERVEISVDADLHAGLTALARDTGTSVFMVMQAACAVLLTKLGAGTDIPIGSPIAGRTDSALDDLVGMFVNTLVLRTDTSGDPTVRDLLDRIRDTDLAAYDHQDLPFERLVEVLNPARSLSRQPLFQVMLTSVDTVPPPVPGPDGMDAGPTPTADSGAKCDLSFNVSEQQDGMTGTLEFSLDLFTRPTAEAIVARLLRVLTQLTAAPDARISTIDVLTAAERREILHRGTTTGRYVLDADHNPVPPGGAGSLFVAGHGELDNPFGDGVLHDTGTAVRLTPDGEIVEITAVESTVERQPARAPRTERERRLCELFATHLGVDEVGVDDSFFDLGGYSLLAVRLVSGIRKTLGVDITLRTLFDAPTVAQLAAHLDGTSQATSFDVLLPLRTGGDAEPYFFVHPLGGLSWLYSAFGPHVPVEHDLYGLQARGIATDEPLPTSIAEMAADYVAQIRRVQPHGPYHLLGWSLGGNVAHAMAAQLEQAGERVALLALLDAYPRTERRAARGYDEAEFLDGLLRFVGVEPQGEADLGAVMAVLRDTGSVLAELTEDQLRALHRVMANSFQLSGEPTVSHTSGDALMFAATQDAAGNPADWNQYVDGRLKVHETRCKHEELMGQDSVVEIGRVIREHLASTEGDVT
jgi:amino acid adenylation domain-containing protein